MKKIHHQVVLSIGCNKGDCSKTFEDASSALNADFTIIRKSSLYLTRAWGNTCQNDFLNQVWLIETLLSPAELLIKLKETEKQFGRTDFAQWQPRPLDMDILFFDDEIISEEGIEIPHPRLTERKFVLIPMAEILPEKIHPLTGKTVLQLLHECRDTSWVTSLTSDVNETD